MYNVNAVSAPRWGGLGTGGGHCRGSRGITTVLGSCFGQRVFTDFVTVEMLFHSKALEVYAHTLQNLETMDVYKDLEVAPHAR